MKRLNSKHILVHLVALWLFAFAFQTYAYLTDPDLSELLRHSNNSKKALIDQNYGVVSLTSLNLSIGFLHTFGLITGFIISIIVSIKRKLFWINSLIAFIIIVISGYLNLLGWNYLKNIFLLPGEAFAGRWYYLINGSTMLLIGLILLLIKRPMEPKKGQI